MIFLSFSSNNLSVFTLTTDYYYNLAEQGPRMSGKALSKLAQMVHNFKCHRSSPGALTSVRINAVNGTTMSTGIQVSVHFTLLSQPPPVPASHVNGSSAMTSKSLRQELWYLETTPGNTSYFTILSAMQTHMPSITEATPT